MINVRSYHGGDETAVIELWNATITHDRINESVFRTRVLLDANFHPDGLMVAEEGGALVGFVLSIARRVPLLLQGLDPDLGWITAFGTHPRHRRRGIGRQLFDAALARLGVMGRKHVLISPYTPNYFVPGVDVDAYRDATAFLQATGWTIEAQTVSMHGELTGFQIPHDFLELEQRLEREDHIIVRPLQTADLPAILPFIAQHFGWDWFRFAQEYLLELFGAGSDEICLIVAMQGDRVVGYCQQKRERFGPIGVAEEARRKGVARLLVSRCLSVMLAKGFHCAWFLGTSKDTARIFSLMGFKQVRQFAVMKREL